MRREKGERRDAGTCVSHGLPMATHAANARVIGASYRPQCTGCSEVSLSDSDKVILKMRRYN